MEVYGHRGAAGEAPENTIAGCKHAVDRGARFIEVDLRLSSDDELVVIHDKTVNRTTYSVGQVDDHAAARLAGMDATKAGPPWSRKGNTGIPTLDDLLAATPEIKRYQLEVKSDSKSKMKRIAEKLAERYPDSKTSKKVVLTSSDSNFLSYIKDMAPHITRGMVALKLNAYKTALEHGCKYYCMHWSNCSSIFIRELHQEGIHASVWTVNDEQNIKKLHRMKADSVMTDYPSMAIPLIAALER